MVEGLGAAVSGKASQEAFESKADAEVEAAQFNETLRKARLAKQVSTQTAQAGQFGGFSASEAEVIADTVIESELQGDIDLYNAQRRANLLAAQGKEARRAGNLDLFGGVLGAFGGLDDGLGKDLLDPKLGDFRKPYMGGFTVTGKR